MVTTEVVPRLPCTFKLSKQLFISFCPGLILMRGGLEGYDHLTRRVGVIIGIFALGFFFMPWRDPIAWRVGRL